MGKSNGKMDDPSQVGVHAAAPTGRPESANLPPPDPEVPAKAVRRSFSAEYKQRILREADNCAAEGAIGPCCAERAAHTDGFRALHALTAGREFGRQQAVVGCFDSQLSDGGHPDDD